VEIDGKSEKNPYPHRHPVPLNILRLSSCCGNNLLHALLSVPRDSAAFGTLLVLIRIGFVKRIRFFHCHLFAAYAARLPPLFASLVVSWQLLQPFEVISVPKSQIRRTRRLFHIPMRLKHRIVPGIVCSLGHRVSVWPPRHVHFK